MAKRKRLTLPDPARIAVGSAPETKTFPVSAPGRSAPRSAPIADVAADASTAAALEEMADTLRRARDEGRMIVALPLGQIDAGYLVRDRIAVDDEEMAALRTSIAARGQQTPIEVTQTGPDRYGLISGWRRLFALRQLAAEGAEDAGTVLAILRRPQDGSDAYLAMVEENEIRVGLSHYERARIAVKAVDQGVFETHKAALLALFASASRAKRSKIRSFLTIVEALDGALRFPEAIGERLGLALSKRLEGDPRLAPRLRTILHRTPPDTAAEELAVIEAALAPVPAPVPAPAPARPATPGTRRVEVTAGLVLKRAASGALTLSGAAVTDGLEADLLDWLRARADAAGTAE